MENGRKTYQNVASLVFTVPLIDVHDHVLVLRSMQQVCGRSRWRGFLAKSKGFHLSFSPPFQHYRHLLCRSVMHIAALRAQSHKVYSICLHSVYTKYIHVMFLYFCLINLDFVYFSYILLKNIVSCLLGPRIIFLSVNVKLPLMPINCLFIYFCYNI